MRRCSCPHMRNIRRDRLSQHFYAAGTSGATAIPEPFSSPLAHDRNKGARTTMIGSRQRILIGFGAAVALLPSSTGTQTAARSFDELQQVLKVGQVVVVTDETGSKSKGTVAEVSRSSLVILTKQLVRGAAAREPDTCIGRRTFSETAVTEIRQPDPWRNGALIGAGVGAGLALWDYLIDPSEPGNAAITAVAVGLGTAIGAGIDALIEGNRVFYAAVRQRRVTISTLPGKNRQGALVSVRF